MGPKPRWTGWSRGPSHEATLRPDARRWTTLCGRYSVERRELWPRRRHGTPNPSDTTPLLDTLDVARSADRRAILGSHVLAGDVLLARLAAEALLARARARRSSLEPTMSSCAAMERGTIWLSACGRLRRACRAACHGGAEVRQPRREGSSGWQRPPTAAGTTGWGQGGNTTAVGESARQRTAPHNVLRRDHRRRNAEERGFQGFRRKREVQREARSELRPQMRQAWPRLGQNVSIVSNLADSGPTLANSSTEIDPTLGDFDPMLANTGPNSTDPGQSWSTSSQRRHNFERLRSLLAEAGESWPTPTLQFTDGARIGPSVVELGPNSARAKRHTHTHTGPNSNTMLRAPSRLGLPLASPRQWSSQSPGAPVSRRTLNDPPPGNPDRSLFWGDPSEADAPRSWCAGLRMRWPSLFLSQWKLTGAVRWGSHQRRHMCAPTPRTA